MSKVASHIIRRGSKLQYRRRVPDDVRQVRGFAGREHFQTSLRTSDPIEGRRKAVVLDEWFERECASARGAITVPVRADQSNSGMVLSDSYLKAYQDRYVAFALSADLEERLRARTNPELQETIDERDDGNAPAYVADVDGNIVHRERSEARHRLIELEEIRRNHAGDVALHAEPFGAAPGSPNYARIEAMHFEAERLIRRAIRERDPGSFGQVHRPSDAVGPSVKPESTWTLKTLADRYLEVHPKGASWRHKVNVAVSLFEQFLAKPTPISAITADHIRGFVELLAMSPQRAAMRFPRMGLQDAVAANRTHQPKSFPCISANTIRDNHFAVLRVLLGYACGDLGVIAYDPTAHRKIKGTTKKAGHSSQFEIDEMRALFALPMFTGCQSTERTMLPGPLRLTDHRFWAPLIMLFSGMRPSEVAQLAVTDIKLAGDFPSISVLTESDANDPEDRPYVLAFKTPNARRSVPLHPQLMELGFADYVRRIESQRSPRLFPEWKASLDPRKLYSGATWVRRFNEKCIPAITNRKPKPSIYSLRHTFKTQMAVSRVPPQFQDQVLGHASRGMDPFYLKNIPIRDLYEEIAKVNYRDLDLAHLKR